MADRRAAMRVADELLEWIRSIRPDRDIERESSPPVLARQIMDTLDQMAG